MKPWRRNGCQVAMGVLEGVIMGDKLKLVAHFRLQDFTEVVSTNIEVSLLLD